MVQMKVTERPNVYRVVVNFISHMVQMKVCCLTLCPFLLFSFISHMVQMKGYLWCGLPFSSDCLYIPHGSDESIDPYVSQRSSIHFISHMVQMKVMESLYRVIKTVIFISHMVQMKAGG